MKLIQSLETRTAKSNKTNPRCQIFAEFPLNSNSASVPFPLNSDFSVLMLSVVRDSEETNQVGYILNEERAARQAAREFVNYFLSMIVIELAIYTKIMMRS